MLQAAIKVHSCTVVYTSTRCLAHHVTHYLRILQHIVQKADVALQSQYSSLKVMLPDWYFHFSNVPCKNVENRCSTCIYILECQPTPLFEPNVRCTTHGPSFTRLSYLMYIPEVGVVFYHA